MRTVGIDIGSFSVKVAELDGQGHNAVLRDFQEFPLNHDPQVDTRFDKVEILKQVAAQYDPRVYNFVVGLGTEFTTSRILTFPFTERRKILQSLPFELEDVIPFSQSDAIFDFRIISQRGNTSKVLAFAVPKRYLQDLLNLCDDAGISPDFVVPEAVALSNHFENYDQAPLVVDPDHTMVSGPAQLIIHIGYKKTLINVVQDKSLIASRALYYGGQDLTNAISRAYQLPYFEALKGVAEKGFVLTNSQGANEDQIAFSQTISQNLNQLITDLQRTIVDLKAELQCEFDSGLLLGGMSKLINFGPYLTLKLGIPFSVAQILGKTVHSDIPQTEENEKAASVAVGLAIEPLRKPKNPPVNLRKNEFSKQNQNLDALILQYKSVAQMGAVLFIAFFIYTSFRASFAQDNLDAIEKVIKDQSKNASLNITSQQLKPESLHKFIKAKKEEIESRKQVVRLNQMTSALDVMKIISSALPTKERITLDITHFDLEGETMVLEGLVNSKAEADLLQRGLSQLTAVSGVKAAPTRNGPQGKVSFSISFSVARLPQVAEKGTKK